MCGIAGVVRFDQQPIDHDLLAQMARLQQHRGPDDEGFYSDARVGLAFRRLAILDLTSAGHQPMASADGKLWIVFNGEIYNHNELRRELQTFGYSFRSSTDTEVILAAYQQWGVDCLRRFNGMWAFALWDTIAQRLFCARDRFGVKPFYYHCDARRFVFASEIKGLFAESSVPRQPDVGAVYTYLVFGEVYFGEGTFFREIRQLPPAHYMLVDHRGVTLNRYWTLDHRGYSSDVTDDEVVEGFRHLFFDSVRLRLQSDVPVGTCLSGGLDSSSIVCAANQILFGKEKRPDRTVVGERQKTFSACYADARFDERRYIHAVIAQTGAQSHETFPDGEGLFSDLETLVWHQDEPVAGSSVYAQWCVMRRARQAGVVVLLDGQGGDEVAGGYQSYYWAHLAGLLRSARIRSLAHDTAAGWGTRVAPTPTEILGTAYALLPLRLQEIVKLMQKRLIARPWLGPELLFWKPRQQGNSSHPTLLGKALERDLVYDSLPALLRYEDRNSMAHSIEARVPFLDYRLVEFMAAMPDRMKIRDGQMKWLLRQTMKDCVPLAVYQRRDKMGFETPESEWLRQRAKSIQSLIATGEAARRGWLNPHVVTTWLLNPTTLAQLDYRIVWRWLNLELWLRQTLKPIILSSSDSLAAGNTELRRQT